MRIALKKRWICSFPIAFPAKTQQAWQSMQTPDVSAEKSVGTTQDGNVGCGLGRGPRKWENSALLEWAESKATKQMRLSTGTVQAGARATIGVQGGIEEEWPGKQWDEWQRQERDMQPMQKTPNLEELRTLELVFLCCQQMLQSPLANHDFCPWQWPVHTENNCALQTPVAFEPESLCARVAVKDVASVLCPSTQISEGNQNFGFPHHLSRWVFKPSLSFS